MSLPAIIAVSVVVVVVLIAVILVGWGISTANKFKRMRVKIDESASDIDVALTKRFDVLTKQLNIVKGYAKHEHDTFVEVTSMRTGVGHATADDISRLSAANAQMNELARQINLQVERYPELKANAMFANLQSSVNDVEEHLQASRRLYNSNVSRYNQSIIVFPNSIIANMIHAVKADFFEAEEAKRADVEMNF